MDWKLCCVCQEGETPNNHLIDPSLTKALVSSKDLLKLFAEIINKYEKEDCWPSGFDFIKLNMGNTGSLEEWLKVNKAVYHSFCRKKFRQQNLNKLVKKNKSRKRDNSQLNATNINPQKKLRSLDSSFSRPTYSKDDTEKSLPCVFSLICNDPVLPDDPNRREVKTGISTDTGITKTLNSWALIMDDSDLLSKIIITDGDLHAADVVYHKGCYTRYHTIVRSQLRKNPKSNLEKTCLSTQAIYSVIRHMDHMKEKEGCFIFELDDIYSFYRKYLEELDECKNKSAMNRTRFKERLLELAPQLKSENTSSRRIIFFYKESVGDTFQNLDKNNSMTEDSKISDVIKIIREYLLEPQSPFSGTFSEKCEEKAVNEKGLNFFKELLVGKSTANDESHCHRAALTLYQLTALNCRAKVCNKSKTRIGHEKETPLSLYIALKLHLHTRSKKLVNEFHKLGLCISYDRLLELLKGIENTVKMTYNEEEAVFPLTLPRDVFVTVQDDNIDISISDYHGTALSVITHSTSGNPGRRVPFPEIKKSDGPVSLHEEFVNVKPAYLANSSPMLPKSQPGVPLQPEITNVLADAKRVEQSWLQSTESVFKPIPKPALGWAAFHAKKIDTPVDPVETAVLHIWPNKADTPAMQKHCMEVAIAVTNKMNPGQTPVLTNDNPLYAICKQLQLQHKETLGEDKLFLKIGDLHVEMLIIMILAVLLNCSGWAEALSDAGITTPGRAEGLANSSSDVNLAAYAHQVTYAALHNLMIEAYRDDMKNKTEQVPFDEWKMEKEQKHPTFMFWSLILRLETLYHMFKRSLREGNFQLYMETLVAWVIWTHALDRINYRRWLPVHLRDLVQLKTRHPKLYEEFSAGRFVGSVTKARFSALPLDQVIDYTYIQFYHYFFFKFRGCLFNLYFNIKNQIS